MAMLGDHDCRDTANKWRALAMIAGIGLSSDLPGAARATAYRVNLSNVAIKEATASNIV